MSERILTKDQIYDSPTSGEIIDILDTNFAGCTTVITHGGIDTSCDFFSNFRLHFYSGIRQELDPITGANRLVGDTLYTDAVLPIIKQTTCPR